MSAEPPLVVAAFPSELPRGSGHETLCVGSGASWTAGPPELPGRGPLIITGSCGALDFDPGIGRLVIPDRVRSRAGDWLEPDARWREALTASALDAGEPVQTRALVEVEGPVDTPAERGALALRSGCGYVDMESASLAAAAEAQGRPWVVLRFLTDSPERPIGWLAQLFGGMPVEEPTLGRTLRALARRPWLLARLTGLGLRTHRGRSAVSRTLRGLPA